MTFQLPRGGKGGDANTVPEVNVPAVIGGGAGDGGNGAKIGLAATNDLYVYNSGGGGGGSAGLDGSSTLNGLPGWGSGSGGGGGAPGDDLLLSMLDNTGTLTGGN